MNCCRKFALVLFLLFLLPAAVFSQYILNGSAQKNSCNCYTLTTANFTQSGSVWNGNKISLSTSFDFWFMVNLGCDDIGADGIVFILQPISTSVGTTGEGMGFAGVSPSIGIAMDTYKNPNLNDPDFDHISIQANGVTNHASDLAGPVPVSSTSNNVEDCQWHRLRISWDAGTKWLKAYFDGVLRVEKQIDLVATIFNNDPAVYWGFTGATGGQVNLQQFCTALEPIFNTNSTNNIACAGSPVQFINASESFAPIVSYNWSFGDGSFSTDANPPTHVYTAPGTYPVNLKIKGLDGCERDSTKTVQVNAIPSAALAVFDTCFKQAPRIQFSSETMGISYAWSLDGIGLSTSQKPILNNLSSGPHDLQVIVSSTNNCGPAVTANAAFIIKPAPVIEALAEDGCINEAVQFHGVQKDNATSINQWNWYFSDNTISTGQNVSHTYSQPQNYTAKLWVNATNNCVSDTVSAMVKINEAFAFAGNDTTVVKDFPFQLTGKGNGSFLWSPATGLSNAAIDKPVVTINQDEITYLLTVATPEGCIATDTILIKTMKGPAIYVPSAFTPNGDGKNDLFRPVYVGIKDVNQFAVFNRWGQMMFSTNDTGKGWDAKGAPAGTYVWFIKAVNILGQPILIKGTVTILR